MNATGWSPKSAGRALLLLLFTPPLAAADVRIQGTAEDLAPCSTLAWETQTRIPVFDPLMAPDQPDAQARMAEIDRRIRERVDRELASRGWKLDANAPCTLTYTLVQEVDLDFSRHGEAPLAPRSSDPVGGGLPNSVNSEIRRLATFTLGVSELESGKRIWRGSLRDKVGKSSDVPKRAERLAREVLKEFPRR